MERKLNLIRKLNESIRLIDEASIELNDIMMSAGPDFDYSRGSLKAKADMAQDSLIDIRDRIEMSPTQKLWGG